MGAWGTAPYDNDRAADWFSAVLSPVSNSIDELLLRKVSESLYDEYRAAAWLLARIGLNYVYTVNRRADHIKTLIKRLVSISEDERYIGTWESPGLFRASLHALIAELENMK